MLYKGFSISKVLPFIPTEILLWTEVKPYPEFVVSTIWHLGVVKCLLETILSEKNAPKRYYWKYQVVQIEPYVIP